MTWEQYKDNCTTENLVQIAKEAGFVCHYDTMHKFHTIIGNEDALRRFFQQTAGQILLEQIAQDAQRLGLYE